jgi:hypothetical protein
MFLNNCLKRGSEIGIAEFHQWYLSVESSLLSLMAMYYHTKISSGNIDLNLVNALWINADHQVDAFHDRRSRNSDPDFLQVGNPGYWKGNIFWPKPVHPF